MHGPWILQKNNFKLLAAGRRDVYRLGLGIIHIFFLCPPTSPQRTWSRKGTVIHARIHRPLPGH